MIVKDREGNLLFSRSADSMGPFYCSMCGKHLRVGETYTKRAIYHAVRGTAGVIARCTTCFPVVEAPEEEYRHAVVGERLPPDIAKFDTVVWGNPDAHTTGSMRPVTLESYGSRSVGTTPVSLSTWEREAPGDVADIMTENLESIRRIERREREKTQHHFTDKIRRVLHLSTGDEGWLR